MTSAIRNNCVQSKLLHTAFLALTVNSVTAQAANKYIVTPLDFQAIAINNKGHILGYNYERGHIDTFQTPVIWQNNVITPIGKASSITRPPSSSVNVNDQNDQDQVTGSLYLYNEGHSKSRAFIWQNGVKTDLSTLGGDFSYGHNINNKGDIAGRSDTADGSTHAVLWQDGLIKDLGTLGGDYSTTTDINDKGQILGSSTTKDGSTHPFLWQEGVMTDLSNLAGRIPWSAAAINDKGQFVGGAHNPNSPNNSDQGYLWDNGILTDLGYPGPLNYGASYATDINNNGQIVGVYNVDEFRHAFIWENGVMTDLGLGISDGSLHININDLGQIIIDLSYPLYTDDSWSSSYLLTPTSPIPLPAAIWLFGSALATLGWFNRRKTV
jgi:probable HAF family extracellular repeat protein